MQKSISAHATWHFSQANHYLLNTMVLFVLSVLDIMKSHITRCSHTPTYNSFLHFLNICSMHIWEINSALYVFLTGLIKTKTTKLRIFCVKTIYKIGMFQARIVTFWFLSNFCAETILTSSSRLEHPSLIHKKECSLLW